jgi:predicted amidohydrolase YtcJ
MPARYLTPGDEGRGLEVLQAEVEAAAGSGPDAGLRFLGIKIFTDGSLGAHTAFLRRPYADAPATRGTPLYARQELDGLARRVDAAGYQLMVHAIGDAGLDLALDALEPVLRGGNRLRHRIEHAEVTPPDLVARLAASGVRVCVQPNFARRWSQPGGMNEQRLGERLVHCNAYRSLHAAGIRLAFGSDTMPLGPTYGLAGAVAHPLAPERLDAGTALHLYTAAAAELVGATGRIAPGSPADLVVLEVGPAAAAGGFAVEATFVAGRQVHPPAPPG